MTMKEQNKPKRRFAEFTDDWEQRKLGEDLVSIHTGTNLLGSITNTGMPLIKMGNIQRGYFDISKVEYLTENEHPEKDDIANYGDFFFNTRNTLELVGKGATWMENSGEYAFNSNIARFELRDLDTIFFNYLYNTEDMTKQIHARAMGTTSVAAIYPRTLGSVEYFVPCMDEQKKIGAYFRHLDHLITLHQRKLEKLKEMKKAYLSEMFPQENEKRPRRRFQGFTDDWEQRKLVELAEKSYGGGTPTTSNEAFWNGNIPWIQSSDIVDGKLYGVEPRKHITQEGLNNSAAQLVPKNSIAIITRVGVGKLVFMPFSYTTSQDFLSLSKLNTEPFFTVYACYQKLQSELNEVQGTSIKGITKDELLAKTIMVPKYAEQQKIGKYFSNLDHLITLHQRKLEKLKNIKKAYLNEMFI